MKNLCFALGFVVAVGCGTDRQLGPDTLPNLTVPPAPAPNAGFQVITPIFENVMPGGDYEVCTWTDQILAHDVDIRSTLGYQTEPPGHHVIMYYTTVRQPPNTQRVCNDSDMATFRFLAGGAGEGETTQAPGNLVFHAPAGAQIVINHHYLNTTDRVLRGQSVINANYADPNGSYIHNGYVAIVNTNLQIPVGDQTQTMHAVIDQTYKAWSIIPHMHQWGKHTTITITQSGNAMKQFDLDWDPSYTFHPPKNTWDVTAPMLLQPGDMIDVSCEWNNTTSNVLTFGPEMCVSFLNTIDDQNLGSRAWDDGSWVPF